MNQSNRYVKRGYWVFAFLFVSMFATLYFAMNIGYPPVAYTSFAVSLILALMLFILLWQTGKTLEKSEGEATYLRRREKERLQKEQQDAHDEEQQEKFDIDEALARIIPATGAKFDSVAACTENVLQNIARELDTVQGLVFVLNDADQLFHISGQYAYYSEEQPRSFPMGETLSGQVAKNRKLLNLNELPEGYITVLSGLGKSNPRYLLIVPIVHGGESIGVMELASFKPFDENKELLARRICESIANLLNELRK